MPETISPSSTTVSFYVKGIVKKFYCDTKEICAYKQHFCNQRCWAVYAIRSTCPHLARDTKRIEQLARE